MYYRNNSLSGMNAISRPLMPADPVFENSAHDFPKKLEYRLGIENKLTVIVTGEKDKGFSINFIRRDDSYKAMNRTLLPIVLVGCGSLPSCSTPQAAENATK